MRHTMTADRARIIAQDAATARRKWGKHASPPYTVEQLMEAFELLDEAGYFERTPDDLHATLVRISRQEGAAKAREKKSAKNELGQD